MSSEITPINKKLAIISGNGDLPLSILESAVSNGWNGVVIDIADNQKLKSQSNWKIYDFTIGNIGKIFKKLHLEKINHIVLCGGIRRPKLYEMKFDFKGLNIMSKIAFKGDDGALKILSEEIENEGFNIISANHFYSFFILSVVGFLTYIRANQIMYLSIYLIFLSFLLEIMHYVIPNRSFEYPDLFGNLAGVIPSIVVRLIFKINENFKN